MKVESSRVDRHTIKIGDSRNVPYNGYSTFLRTVLGMYVCTKDGHGQSIQYIKEVVLQEKEGNIRVVYTPI